MTTAPSHVVVLSLENKGFDEVIGNPLAPNLNLLASMGMLFTNFNAVAHPSQPNYLALFSGSTQGVTDDTVPSTYPSYVPTLASSLANAGLTFAGYAESGAAPWHTPWQDFDSSTGVALPFSAFPTTAAGFDALPTVSFVTPSDVNNMTNTVASGDAWLGANIMAYAAWAQANNSLLVITFDEGDDGEYPNQIATIVLGAGVPAGVLNNQAANQYALLATIQDLYGLAPIGETGTAPILDLYSATPTVASSLVTNQVPGISDSTNWPPQNALAVGPNFVVTSETSRLQWTNLSTNVTTSQSLYSVFASAPNAGDVKSLLDTRFAYDSASGLYVGIALVYHVSTGNIDIDIATTTNPDNGWSVATLATGSTSTDMPGLSVDGSNVVITAQVSGGTTTFVVPLADVVNGATITTASPGVNTLTNINNGHFNSVSGGDGVTFLIASYSNGAQTYLNYQTYDANSGVFTPMQNFALGNSDQGSGGNDFVVAQAGSSATINAGSGTIKSLAYATIDGHNYVYGVSLVKPVGATQPQLEWFQLDVTNAADGVTLPVLVQGGDISAASLGFSSDVALFNASIAVNGAGDVLINFTASGASILPADYYIVAGRNESFGAPVLFQASSAPVTNNPLGSADPTTGVQRWGVTSSVVVDPNDPNAFWISNEFFSSDPSKVSFPAGSSAWWGTATARVLVNPPAPVITSPSIGGLAPSNGLQVAGTGYGGDTINVFIDGVSAGSTTVGSNGGWVFTFSTPIAAGSHSVTATEANAAGASQLSNADVFTVSIGPVVSSVVASPVDASLNAGATVMLTVNFSDNVIVAGSPFLVLDDGGIAIYAGGSGTNALAFTYVVQSGQNTFDLSVLGLVAEGGAITDASGNQAILDGAAANPAGILLIDTNAPDAPAIAGISPDTGASATDGLTNLASVAVSGTAEAGGTVRLYDGAILVATLIADSSGAWTTSSNITLAEGVNNLTATTIDAAGNVSAPSGAFVATLDTTPPAQPTIAGISPDSGASATDGTTNIASVAVSGTAEAGSAVQLYDGGILVAALVADSSGAWKTSSNITLAEGVNNLTATAADALNNVSTPSAIFAATLDTAAPGLPVISGISPDSGRSAADGVTNVASVAVSGSAESNSMVRLYDGAILVATVAADASGNWTTANNITLAQGVNNLTATATDAAGNASAPSATYIANLDTTAPGLPAISGIAPDTGTSATDGITAAATVAVSGTAESNSTVLVYDGGILVATVAADASGKWTTASNVALAQGANNLTATATDAAGNVSGSSGIYVATLDTSGPAAPAIAGISPDNGTSATDGTTNVASVAVSGTAEAKSTVKLYDGAILVATVAADASGNWTTASNITLAQGVNNLTATATDAVSHVSAPSATFVATLDTAAPTVTSVVDNPATANLNAGKSVTLTVNFSESVFVAGAPRLALNDGGVATYAGGSGTNALAFTYVVLQGQNTSDLTVSSLQINGGSIKDQAGNAAVVSGAARNPAGTLKIDTTAPTVTINTIAGNDILSGTEAASASGFSIGGRTSGAETGQAISVKLIDHSNAVVGSFATTTANNNMWSVALTSAQALALADGAYTVTANVSDAAGNAAAQATRALTVDEDKGPETPILTLANSALLVAAGGSVALGVTATPVDGDDRLSVVIAGLPSYETISAPSGYNVSSAKQADGTFTWTVAETTATTGTAISNLTLASTYTGTGQPVANLIITANNLTAGETASSPSQTLAMTDPPVAGSGAIGSGSAAVAALLIEGGSPAANLGLLGQYAASFASGGQLAASIADAPHSHPFIYFSTATNA
jgi:hypothetical protein